MTDTSPRILIADDQPDVLKALQVLLKGQGYRMTLVASPAEVMEALGGGSCSGGEFGGVSGGGGYDAILMDLNYTRDTTSGREGMDLLKRIQQTDRDLPIIVMTAFGSVELAVEAMQNGACDFILKPWENERLVSIIHTQVELAKALRRGRRLEAENEILRHAGEVEMIARSAAMQPVLELIRNVGPSDANVLLTGAHGTGKGLIATMLHNVSERADQSMITVNAGGLPENIFESELFGHVKGAFTDATADRVGRFELADGGTLFLDEIGNISPVMQAKLLHAVDTRQFEPVGSSKTVTVDVRIISATNMDIRKAIGEGTFREDLLFRLNTIEIALPSLSERREDIPLLAGHFLEKQTQRYRKPLDGFDSRAMQAMLEYRWPGNVRELEHVIERAVLMARGDSIRPDDLGLSPGSDALGSDAPGSVGTGSGFESMTLDEVESLLVRKAMARFDGNVNRAAKALGLSRSALYRRLVKLGMMSGDDDGTEA